MEAIWEHPEFGPLKRNGAWWRTVVDAPAFDAFSYDTGYSNAGPPSGKYDVMIAADKASASPAPGSVLLAQRVLRRQAPLVTEIATALWEDFNGRGPDSGMWWHGGLDQFPNMLSHGLRVPTNPDDVRRLMRLHLILIRDDVPGVDGAVVELDFWAAFEQEHNIGVLTDGEKVLGAGYETEVTPYGFEYE